MAIETTYSQARESLKSLMDRAVQDREVVLVRRRKGGDVAMVAAEELSSLLETAHLLRSPVNAERLLTALGRAREQGLPVIDLADLDARLSSDERCLVGGSASGIPR
ncbi:MAG: type II toxin-antitoxin system Phd/YefM family antitoxin [Prochlorococcaceae cyanobacterium]